LLKSTRRPGERASKRAAPFSREHAGVRIGNPPPQRLTQPLVLDLVFVVGEGVVRSGASAAGASFMISSQ
jgi:hypothetical protein